MTSEQAAAELGVSARRVRRLAAAGLLPGAERAGRDWVIPSDAVSAEQARRMNTRPT
ncbi:helix-turn-helix domain-containing protein [Actinosynnema sp. NPDC023587]|uniref:helix-turn-helix domain-containing protein n=1 Tax=Actinosynnema sp. NPDC023587 TaxID=3154695 RepID=UPI0033D23872